MIATQVPSHATGVTAEQAQFLLSENYLTFGSCLNRADLIAARHAYERVHESHPLGEDVKKSQRLVFRPQQYADEPALMRLIGNPLVLAIAEAALGTRDFIYTGGYMAKTSFASIPAAPQTMLGWHPDLFLRPGSDAMHDDRIAVWIYMDDVTPDEGATALIPGSAAVIREFAQANTNWGKWYELERVKAMCRAWEALPPEQKTTAAAPAGGGFAFGSFALHALVHNVSGIPRRLITMDFAVRGSHRIDPGQCYYQMLSLADQQRIIDAAPVAARPYLPPGPFDAHFTLINPDGSSSDEPVAPLNVVY